MKRDVEVNWLRTPGDAAPTQENREVGWSGLDLEKVCLQISTTLNEQDLTEQAASGVMALLISDLENGVLQTVLQIGSGGDYLIRRKGTSSFIQVEISGIKVDPAGSLSGPRLRQKTEQVLTHRRVGYVSVTTFSYRAGGIVHSYLHYVKRQKRPGGRPGKKGGKK
jgi:hypothetical protein